MRAEDAFMSLGTDFFASLVNESQERLPVQVVSLHQLQLEILSLSHAPDSLHGVKRRAVAYLLHWLEVFADKFD